MRISVKSQSRAGKRVSPLWLSGVMLGLFGCMFCSPAIAGTSFWWSLLAAVGLGWMAARTATDEEPAWAKQDGGRRGAMAGVLTMSVAWALSLSLTLKVSFPLETHGLRPMAMPA